VHAGALDLADARLDQLRPHGRLVGLLEDVVDLRPVGVGDAPDDRGRVLVAGLDAVEVQHGQAAEPAHRHGERDVDDAVHRRAPEGDGKLQPAQAERDVDLVGVDGHPARHQRDLVEPVRTSSPSPDADLRARCGVLSQGLDGYGCSVAAGG